MTTIPAVVPPLQRENRYGRDLPWSAAFGSSYAATQILFAAGFALALLPFRWSLGPGGPRC